MQFEISDDDIDTKDDRTTNTNIKEGCNNGNWNVANPNIETIDLPGDVVPQGFESESDKEDVIPEFFDTSALSEGASIYYIFPEATNMFYLKKGQNMFITIKIWMDFCFTVANNVALVEDILDMHNVENTLTESEIYKARIHCH